MKDHDENAPVRATEKALTPEVQLELEACVRGDGPFEEGDPKEIKKLVEQAEALPQKHDEGPWQAMSQRVDELQAEVGAGEQRALITEGKEPRPQIVHDDPPESGVAVIYSNDNFGNYTVTGTTWDGTLWNEVASSHPMYRVSARDRESIYKSALSTIKRLNGTAGDYVIYREMIKDDGSTEIVIDLTTTILRCKITDISLLPDTVDAFPCDSGGGNVDIDTTLVLDTIGDFGGGFDNWVVPDISVGEIWPYMPRPGAPEYGTIIAGRWKHAGPGAVYLDTSTLPCLWADMKVDEKGHGPLFKRSNNKWYNLAGVEQ